MQNNKNMVKTSEEIVTNEINFNFNASITIAKCTERDKTYYQVRMCNSDGNYVPLKEYNNLSTLKAKSANLFKRLFNSIVEGLADSEQDKFNEEMEKIIENKQKFEK